MPGLNVSGVTAVQRPKKTLCCNIDCYSLQDRLSRYSLVIDIAGNRVG